MGGPHRQHRQLVRGYLVCLVLSLCWGMALSDGTVVRFASSSQHRWKLVGEKWQLAFIHYRDGLEKMIMKIATKTREKNALWLFPVPANPSSVRLNILWFLPVFNGASVLSLIQSKLLEELRPLMYASQIYTFPYVVMAGYKDRGGVMESMPGMTAGVTVHEHLEKGGVIAEKITAKDTKALYEYLRKKGLGITKGMLPMLDYYVGKDYTFIVSWFSETPTEDRRAEAIYVSFPSSQIYYPLLPTSAYGDEFVPAFIYVIGYYTPQISPQLEPYTTVDYYQGTFKTREYVPYETPQEKRRFAIDKDLLEEFLAGSSKEDGFTLITLKSPARNYTSDLVMTPGAPRKLYIALAFLKYSSFIKLFLFLFCSCLASLIAGLLTFGRVKKDPFLFFYLGIFNFFSLLGMAFAVASLSLTRKGVVFAFPNIETQKEGSHPLNPGGEKEHHYWLFVPSWRMKLVFLILFSVLFLILSFLTTTLLSMPFEKY